MERINNIGLAKLVPRFEGVARAGSCFETLCGDTELKSAISKISAHLETNARHCQVVYMVQILQKYMHWYFQK